MIPMKERRSMVAFDDEAMSIVRQCELLSLYRSGLYYTPSEETGENLEIMRYLDEQYLATPFYGVERILASLLVSGYKINRKRLGSLMKLVGWQTIYLTKRTTVSDGKAYKYPYLLKDLAIEHPNQVWAIDITYIPMKRGFMYLFAKIDVYSRYVVGWSLSNTMSAE